MTAPVETPPAAPAAPAGPPANPTFVAPPAAPSPADMPPVLPPAPEGKGDPKESDESPDLAKLRKENANWRTKLREQEATTAAEKTAREQQAAEMKALKDQFAAIGAIFNPDANQPPDPAKLLEQISAKDAEIARVTAAKDQAIRDLTVKAALPGVLAKHHADPTGTVDRLTVSGELAKLDPASDTFAADLESVVAAAVEQNPYLKVAQVAPRTQRSGAEIPGRSGGDGQVTREQLAGMKPEQIEEARVSGRLRNLLSGG